jgi:hypothetical protein
MTYQDEVQLLAALKAIVEYLVPNNVPQVPVNVRQAVTVITQLAANIGARQPPAVL